MREQADSDPATSTALTEVRRLEARLDALIDAVEVLARGLEGGPMAPEDRKPEEAARRARELLLLAKQEDQRL
jgi:hypothetical protein